MPKIYDQRRESSTKRGYGYKWQQARNGYLRKHAWCIRCNDVATIVDHIKPHRNDMQLFWDRNNWQPLCKQCHDTYKQRLEKTGMISGCNASGIPIDPNHHWNR